MTDAHRPLFPLPAFLVLVLSWLIPGYGFFHFRRWVHALFFFVTLQGVFLAGSWLYGAVLLPEFDRSSEGWNIVAILMFLTQMMNGGLAIVSLLPDVLSPAWALFPQDETHFFADLGAFYLLVSGGLNYFVIVGVWDNFYRKKPAAKPAPAESTAAAEGNA